MKKLIFIIGLFISTFLYSQVQVVTLNGSASSDPDGTIAKYQWSQVETTPSLCVITNATLSIATVVPANGQQWLPGTYKFVLTVTDNLGATNSDTVNVTFSASLPVVDAGLSQTTQASSATLKASARVTLGIVKSWAWSQQSGPGTAIFSRKDTSTAQISGLIAGIYIFRIDIVDNYGGTANDTVSVKVIAANQIPKANAGADQTITLPTNSVSIGGFDFPAGVSVLWTQTGGVTAFIASPNASFTQITGLTRGIYSFQKKVVNSSGFAAVDDVIVTVNKKCSWWQKLWGCK